MQRAPFKLRICLWLAGITNALLFYLQYWGRLATSHTGPPQGSKQCGPGAGSLQCWAAVMCKQAAISSFWAAELRCFERAQGPQLVCVVKALQPAAQPGCAWAEGWRCWQLAVLYT